LASWPGSQLKRILSIFELLPAGQPASADEPSAFRHYFRYYYIDISHMMPFRRCHNIFIIFATLLPID